MMSNLKMFWADKKGNVAMTFGLTLPVILAAAGLSVDTSMWRKTEQHMQDVADIAAIAAVRSVFAMEDGQSAQAVAQNYMSAQDAKLIKNATISATANPADRTVTVTTKRPRDRAFSTLFNVGNNAHVITAVAKLPRKPPLCIATLNRTEPRAMNLSGGAHIHTPNCAVQVNSADDIALEASNNAAMTASEFCVVGDVHSSSYSSLTPPPMTHCVSLGDPLEKVVPVVVPTSCDESNFKSKNNQVVTMSPGVYCGGLTFSPGSEVTMEPGEYYVVGGSIRFGSAKVTGEDVVIYLVDASVSLAINGAADIHLVGRRSGLLKGFVIVANPAITTEIQSDLTGAASLYLEGVVYLRTHDLKFAGTVETSDSPYLSIIGDELTFTGTVDYSINADASLTTVPMPHALKAATAGNPYLIQ